MARQATEAMLEACTKVVRCAGADGLHKCDSLVGKI